MTSPIHPIDPATARAAHELARLNGQVEAMRSVLIRLLQDVVVAERRLSLEVGDCSVNQPEA